MTKVGMFVGIIAKATVPPLALVSFLWGTVSMLFRFQGQAVQIGMLVSKLGVVQILLCCLSVELFPVVFQLKVGDNTATRSWPGEEGPRINHNLSSILKVQPYHREISHKVFIVFA